MKFFRLAAVALAAALPCFGPLLHAAGTNAAPRPQPARWLLIVDTSSGMEKRAEAVQGVVGEMVSSGMNGQMHPGDEFGIWTYNKKLSAGVAPMQSWDPARSNIIAGRTVGFLAKQSYTGKAKPELVFTELEPIVRSSRQLTVVMLSDGAVDVAGTPFDTAINAAYVGHRPALKKSRMPLVTVLRGYKGQYMAHQVAVAPWIAEFPPFPAEPVKTNTPAIVAPVAKPEPKRTIIIRPEPKKVEAVEPAVTLQPGAVTLRNPPEPAPDAKPVVIEPLPSPSNVQLTPVVTPAATPVQPVSVPNVNSVDAAPASKPAVEPAPAVSVPVAPATTPAAGALAVTAPAAAASVQSPATSTGDDLTVRKWPLILGITLMWVAIVVALMLARRARRANASSLITQSFDKK